MKQQQQEIFYHVGLGKTASTYFQYKFFPKLKGIYYIQRTKYRRYPKIVAKCNAPKILVSNESEFFFEKAIKQFSSLYPEGKIIIVLRRPDSWLASQYRRQVKNGMSKPFSQFVDVENNNGVKKREDFLWSHFLDMIDKYLKNKPLILFYDDFIKDNYATFNKMAEYMEVTYNKKDISLSRKHTSYSEKQLKAIRSISKYVFSQKKKHIEPYFLRKLNNYQRRLKSYIIMYTALLIPKALMSDEPLIQKEELDKAREYYAADWEKCKEMAKTLSALFNP